MKRLTRRSKVNEALPTKHLNLMHMDTTSEDTLTDILEKLAYYEDLDESGLLKIAPIKDGTKIFYIDDRDFMDFEKMVFDGSYLFGFTEYCHGEFNKDWFLTRDEAELKLKEMK